MKRRIRLTATVCAVLSAMLPATAMGGELAQLQNQAAALIGCWQCQRAGAMAALIFHSPNHLSQDGVHYRYMLIPGAIRVSDGYEYADYYYKTNGRQLVALYPDGSLIRCVRSDCSSLVTTGNQSSGSTSGGYGSGSASGGYGSGAYNSQVGSPSDGTGSWETEGSRLYNEYSGGYPGGAYDNPSSYHYDYND